MRHLPFICVLLCLSGFAAADKSPNKTYYALDLGIYVSHLQDRFNAPSGYASDVSTIEGFVRIRPSFTLGKGFFLETNFGVGVPGRSGVDGKARTFTVQIDANLLSPITSWWAFRAGPGLHSLLLVSGYGEAQLQNGSSSSFETYYTPGGLRASLAVSLQAGMLFRLSKKVQLNIDAIVQSPLNATRRSFDGIVSVGVVL